MSLCDEVTRSIEEGLPLDASLRAHAEHCASCSPLVAADEALAGMVKPTTSSAELSPLLRSALLAETAKPSTGWSLSRRLPPMLLGIAASATLAYVVSPRADLFTQPRAMFLGVLAAWIGGALLTLALVLARGRYGLGVSRSVRLPVLLASPVVSAVLISVTTVAVEGSIVLSGAMLALSVFLCSVLGCTIAALVGLVLVRGARGSAAVDPMLAGAAAGLSAGFAGTLFQQIHCPVAQNAHTLPAHVLPLLLGPLVGAFVARRWLAP